VKLELRGPLAGGEIRIGDNKMEDVGETNNMDQRE
jgi:hypothetical protein